MFSNRRLTLPVLLVGIAVCFAIISLPVMPIGANHALQGTEVATVNPCNPLPAVPGRILGSTLVVYDMPAGNSTPRIIVKSGDIVSVLGKNQSAFWVLVKTYDGIEGWASSVYVSIDKKKFAALPVVDQNAASSSAAATPAATMEGTAEGTEAAAPCPGVQGVVVSDGFSIKVAPNGQSKSEGAVLKKGDTVQVIALNSSGSWFLVVKGTDQGWIGSAFVQVRGSLANVPHNYADAEITLTPVQ